MKNLVVILLFFLVSARAIESRCEELLLNGQSTAFVKIDGALISKDCESNRKCLSFASLHDQAPVFTSLDKASFSKLTNQKKRQRKIKGLHPASEFCNANGGRNYVFENEVKDHVDVCKFADNSMISSWDLYYAHHNKVQAE